MCQGLDSRHRHNEVHGGGSRLLHRAIQALSTKLTFASLDCRLLPIPHAVWYAVHRNFLWGRRLPKQGLGFPQILIILIPGCECSPHRCRGNPPTSMSRPRPGSKILLRGRTTTPPTWAWVIALIEYHDCKKMALLPLHPMARLSTSPTCRFAQSPHARLVSI
ncbi:hypothetical protein BDW72DRAFT_6444 [Aspergillus terricola var. indicus]